MGTFAERKTTTDDGDGGCGGDGDVGPNGAIAVAAVVVIVNGRDIHSRTVSDDSTGWERWVIGRTVKRRQNQWHGK